MNALKSTLLITMFLPLSGWAISDQAMVPPTDKHHVMWTNAKGDQKCCTKKNKEKAERCAAKLRGKKATNIQVMAGACKDM